jgi:transposase
VAFVRRSECGKLAAFYSAIGRPSIDPELMIRMLIVGYCYGIRSERRLCEEVELHLAYRWFCRLDPDDQVPDHSTFSVNRHGRFRDSDILRQVFEAVVRACMDAGLVRGEGFAVDASVIEANTCRYHGKAPDEIAWAEPERRTRAVKEYLAGLDVDAQANPDRKPPKMISPSDPCSAKANKRVQFGYDEVESTKTMLDRTEQRLGLKPKRLAADTAYGTGRFLGWLVGRRIVPHIPVRDASERDDGTLSRSDFRWDRRRGVYICPNGKVLHTTGTVHEGNTLRYRASKFDCEACPLKMQCCPNSPTRQIPRDVHEYARDVTRRLMRTKAFRNSRDERKRVEMRFAHLKVHHGFERMRLPLMITSVGCASKSPPIQRPQTQQPAQLSLIKTTQKHKANRTSYFFNNIDPSLPKAGLFCCAAKPSFSICDVPRMGITAAFLKMCGFFALVTIHCGRVACSVK